jgi:Flp pilus assembly protein TadG
MLRSLSRFRREQSGASAVEFAIVVPIFAGLIFLVMNACVALWAEAALNFTVDAAARCMSVRPGVCDTAADAIKQAPYLGPNISPAFTAVQSACGYSVSGTATYTLNAALVSLPVPLSASSCFPVQD